MKQVIYGDTLRLDKPDWLPMVAQATEWLKEVIQDPRSELTVEWDYGKDRLGNELTCLRLSDPFGGTINVLEEKELCQRDDARFRFQQAWSSLLRIHLHRRKEQRAVWDPTEGEILSHA